MELSLWPMGELSLFPFNSSCSCPLLGVGWRFGNAERGPELTFRDYHRTFLNKVFKFMGIGIALYAIVRLYIYCSDDETIIKHEKKCQYCRKKISLKVWIVLVHQ
jgi:hypothetical protein